MRYARICTSEVDFVNKLHRLPLHRKQQGFKYTLSSNPLQILQEPWGHHRFKYQTTLLEYRNKIDRNKNGTSLYQKIFFSLYMYMTFNFNYVLNCGHSSDTLNSNFSSFSTCYRSNQSELLQTGLYNYSCKISYM